VCARNNNTVEHCPRGSFFGVFFVWWWVVSFLPLGVSFSLCFLIFSPSSDSSATSPKKHPSVTITLAHTLHQQPFFLSPSNSSPSDARGPLSFFSSKENTMLGPRNGIFHSTKKRPELFG
jgi:predicted secreted protein